MNIEDLKQFLETRRKALSEREFFMQILDMLENEPSNDARKVLESYLLTYSYVDEDRVARYLEKFLSTSDRHRVEFALLELFTLAKTQDSLAYKIIAKFTDKIPVDNKKNKSMAERTPGKEMNSERFEQQLEFHRKNLTEKEFFELVFGMLDDDPQDEARNLLNRYILTYSHVDENRVARYLEQFLSDPDPVQREFAALELSILARDPDSLAYKILTRHLGEEPTEDKKTRIVMERLIKLFPHDDEGVQT